MIKIVSLTFMKIVSAFVGRYDRPYAGHALLGLPIVIVREKRMLDDEVLLNHEFIHFLQSLYLLIVGFWVLYLFFWIYNSIKYRSFEEGYKNVPFELEAYAHQSNFFYHVQRHPYGWVKYVKW